MNAILKALAVIAGLFIMYAVYLWTPGKSLWQGWGKVTKSDWILMVIVFGALFLVIGYAFIKAGA